MTNETDSFVQEVDESLRQDRVLQFFKRHGVWIIGALIAIVVVVAAWQGWRAYSMNAKVVSAADEMLQSPANMLR